jgi:hypothetical protein
MSFTTSRPVNSRSQRSFWIALYVAVVMTLTASALAPAARGDCCICEGANQNACTTIGVTCAQCFQACALSGFAELACCSNGGTWFQ